MSININDLEKNQIMSTYSPNVKKESINYVMLELSDDTLEIVQDVTNRVNEKYHHLGGSDERGYTDIFGCLVHALELKLEEDSMRDDDESLRSTVGSMVDEMRL